MRESTKKFQEISLKIRQMSDYDYFSFFIVFRALFLLAQPRFHGLVFHAFSGIWLSAQKQNGYFVQKAKEKSIDIGWQLW